MQQYIVNEDAQILGAYGGGTLPETWQILEGPIAPISELYVEDGVIKQRPPRPSSQHFLNAEGEWILPSEEVEILVPVLNWDGLVSDLRSSPAWSQVYDAAGRTIRANRAFTFLYGSLTTTRHATDLQVAIADMREAMRGITGVGDFSPEMLSWLQERLTANGFNANDFDLNPL